MLATIVLLSLGQQAVTGQYIALKPSELQFPVFGGPQEMIMGVKKLSRRTLGMFVNTMEAGQFGDKIPINYVDARVGASTWSVSPAVLGSTSCLAIDCSANRNQTWEIKKIIYGLRHRGMRTWYVDASGKLLAETCDLEMSTGRWTLDAIYGPDEYTMTTSGPGRPKKTLTVSPGCGIEALTIDPFKPMLKVNPGADTEVLMKEKEFYLLDPLSGSPVKFTARVLGGFSGEQFNEKIKGRQVEIVGGPEKQIAWIAHDGNMVKMNMSTPGAYLELDQKPN